MRPDNQVAFTGGNMATTSNLSPAFPNCSNDTPAFKQAFAEFQASNVHFAERSFWDLPLDDRMAIMRVAQLKKDEARLTNREISDGVINGLQRAAGCFDAF
jgi:hypothetical protein